MIIVIRKRFILFFTCFLICAACALRILMPDENSVTVMADNKSYVAIVIDDFGYDGEGTEEMLSLSIPFTAAVMPFSENTTDNVEKIHLAGKEMIVHMPMESLSGNPSWVGSKAVRSSLTDEEIKSLVNEALGIVKYATGLNNHMGSKIMEDERALNTVIQIMSEKNLVFLDSRTTQNSKAVEVCNENGCFLLNRDVFLDSTDSIDVVKKNLEKTAQIALKNGFALAIGHVGPEGGKITAQAIKEMAPEMEQKGIEFVTISQYAKLKGCNSN